MKQRFHLTRRLLVKNMKFGRQLLRLCKHSLLCYLGWWWMPSNLPTDWRPCRIDDRLTFCHSECDTPDGQSQWWDWVLWRKWAFLTEVDKVLVISNWTFFFGCHSEKVWYILMIKSRKNW
jgi:hypothetical protein